MSSGTCWHCEGDHDTGACPTRKQWTKGEHQPGSPGVDLDALERRLELDLGSWGNSKKYAAVFAELRTLRARVGELEAYAEDIKTISKRGRKIAELEARAESAEARVKELEAAADRNANVIYADESVERYRKRITDLESQLAAAREAERWHAFKLEERSDELIKLRARAESAEARAGELEQCVADLEYELKAAREEQALEAKLGDRFSHIRIMRWSVEWRHDKLGNFFANAKTLPALLRAILAVEKGGPDEG